MNLLNQRFLRNLLIVKTSFASFSLLIGAMFSFWLIFSCNEVQAQSRGGQVMIADNPTNFAPKIDEEAVKQLVMGDGDVSLAEYNRFWQAIGVKNLNEKKAAIAKISEDFLVFGEFNKALLDCAEIAWLQRQEIKCNRALEITQSVAKNYKTQFEDERGRALLERVRNLESGVSAVMRSAAARGVSLNENPEYQISSLEEIRKDRLVLSRVIARTKAFLQVEFGKN